VTVLVFLTTRSSSHSHGPGASDTLTPPPPPPAHTAVSQCYPTRFVHPC
jgi:hypothetical protein